MISKRRFQRSALLVVGLASMALGYSAAVAGSEDVGKAAPVAVASAQSQELTSTESEHSLACRPSCSGPCWTCILGVCENTCM